MKKDEKTAYLCIYGRVLSKRVTYRKNY